MTPAELCEFVDSLSTPVAILKDSHASHLLLELSSLTYDLAEGGDTEIHEVKLAITVLQEYILDKF